MWKVVEHVTNGWGRQARTAVWYFTDEREATWWWLEVKRENPERFYLLVREKAAV